MKVIFATINLNHWKKLHQGNTLTVATDFNPSSSYSSQTSTFFFFFSILLCSLLLPSISLSVSTSYSSWPPLLTASTDLQATPVSALSHIFHAVVIYVFSFFLLFLGWINSLINTTKGKIPLPSSDSSTNNDWGRAVLFVTWSNWYWYRVCK